MPTPIAKFEKDFGPNIIINGAFDFWQRGTSITGFGTSKYLADRWIVNNFNNGVWNATQEADAPDANSTYSLKVEATTADAAPAATDNLRIRYKVEGYDIQPYAGGLFRLQFWCKSNKTGTYAVTITNGANDRSYVTTFAVDSSNIWERKVIDFEHDASGTWDYTNGTGFELHWGLSGGSTPTTATLNQWQNGLFYLASGQTNLADTIGNNFSIAQSVLSPRPFDSSTELPFKRTGRNFQEELSMCLRYFQKSYDLDVAPGSVTAVGISDWFTDSTYRNYHTPFIAPLRATPVITLYGLTGASGMISIGSPVSADVAASASNVTMAGYKINATPGTASGNGSHHYTAESEL